MFQSPRLPALAKKLMALCPLGFFIALIAGRGGRLSPMPLAVGGVAALAGLILHLALSRRQEAKL